MKQLLHIAEGFSLPVEAITQVFAILARRGAGKTYTAAVFAEELLEQNQQVVVIDPLGVWWGLRSSADGKGPGYSIPVLGGERGDVPLEQTAGAVVADMLVEERAAAVIDLSLMRKGQQRHFMTDFLETLYHKNREAMHLIIDEADLYAPQNVIKGSERLLGAMEDIVRRARVRGIGSTLITQRPAVLHKDVLTQAEPLLAMQLSHARDRAAIEEWVRAHSVEEKYSEMKTTLSGLQVGEAWIWSPSWLNQFRRVKIRRRRTFDSSATPKFGVKIRQPKRLADINLGVLQERIAETIEKAKAEDPRHLRRRIAELERQVNTQAPAQSDPKALDQAWQRGHAEGIKTERQCVEPILRLATAFARDRGPQGIVQHQAQIREALEVKPNGAPTPPTSHIPVRPAPLPRPAVSVVGTIRPADPSIKPAQRKILTALAQHPDGLETTRLALLAGYTVNGHFNNMVGQLRTSGHITPARVSPIQITESGTEVLGPFDPLPTGEALRDYWKRRVGSSKSRLLSVLFDNYPNDLQTVELAERAGYTVNGHFNNMLGTLRSMGLVTPARQPLRAMDHLFL